MKYDIAIVGGGAAGMCAAIFAAKKDPSLRIAVIEALDRVGKKLLVTGNGRCNISNRKLKENRYHGQDLSTAFNILYRFSPQTVEKFFFSIGVPFVEEEHGKLFPASLQASSVVNAMRFSLEECGVELLTGTRVESFTQNKNGITLKTSAGALEATSVILATGMFSGGASVGSDGAMFNQLKSMGYGYSKPTPSLVQIKTSNEVVRSLKGIHVDAQVTLFEDRRPVKIESGEVLFTEYGLSGPPILQISREISRKNAEFQISLDLMPKYSKTTLTEKLWDRKATIPARVSDEFLTGFINKRLGQVILKICGVPSGIPTSQIGDRNLSIAAKTMKDFRFYPLGTTGMANSQVTAGGILLSEFNSKTLGSLRHPGIFAAGELLDVDGDCGGYNLQWAWSSAMTAANGAIDFVRNNKA